MDDVYNNIDDFNLNRKRKLVIVIDDIIKEVFIRCRKLNISLVFITQFSKRSSKRSQIKLCTLPNN